MRIIQPEDAEESDMPKINGKNGMLGSTVSTQPSPGVQSGKAAAVELGRMINAQKNLGAPKFRIDPLNKLKGIDYTVLQKAIADSTSRTSPVPPAPPPPPPPIALEAV